jgi:hypothetical protein
LFAGTHAVSKPRLSCSPSIPKLHDVFQARVTCLNVAYALAGAFAGSLAPLLAVALTAASSNLAAPAFVMIAAALLSGAACWMHVPGVKP